MTINIGVAGCLGRMGQEITKKILKDKRLNFVGGFEHKNHPKLNNKICDITDIKSDLIVSSNAAKIIKEVEDEILPIISTLKETLPKDKQVWDSGRKYTTVSSSTYNAGDIPKAFSELHQETMKDKNMGTAMNKKIAHIKAKKQEALDFLFGLNDLNELREGLSNILGKADIKLLGE